MNQIEWDFERQKHLSIRLGFNHKMVIKTQRKFLFYPLQIKGKMTNDLRNLNNRSPYVKAKPTPLR